MMDQVQFQVGPNAELGDRLLRVPAQPSPLSRTLTPNELLVDLQQQVHVLQGQTAEHAALLIYLKAAVVEMEQRTVYARWCRFLGWLAQVWPWR